MAESALVTGGGRGIGRACCLALAREGLRVAVCARTVQQIEGVAAEIAVGGGTAVAWATFRSMEATGTYGVGRAAGLIDLGVDESLRRRGLAIFLLSEAFRQFISQGILLVEAQVMQNNAAAVGVYRKLGFQQIGYGSVFRKE